MTSLGQFEDLLQQYQHGCVFCEPSAALVLGETANFRLMLDVAPVRPGHLILHSKEHFSCAGDVPKNLIGELAAYRTAVQSRMASEFGGWTAYEHGRAGHCLSDGIEHRLCHHFHLHLMPGTSNVAQTLAERFQRVQLHAYEDIVPTYADYGDYLYVEGEVLEFFPVDTPIERHLLRTLIATEDGHPERADWKAFQDPQPLIESHNLARSAFDLPLDVGVGA